MDGVAVESGGSDLVAVLDNRLGQRRGAGEQVGAEGEGRADAAGLHRAQDAEDADPVAVVPRREMAQVGVRRDHPMGMIEWVLLGVDGVELARDHDHHRKIRAVSAADGGAVLGEAPVVPVDVLTVAAPRVFEVFLR